MTRQEMIAKLIDDRTKAEAERYKDKQMDGEPMTPANVVMLKFPVGSPVRLRLDAVATRGFVTGVTLRQAGIFYLVTWSDTRGETGHSDFEIEAVPDVDLPIRE